MENALDGEIAQLGKTPISAFIVAGLLENYYTCLETIFLRISHSFDNNLDAARRHDDLLQKMTLAIDGVRTAAVSEETFSPLFELLKFRHFKRYYFELEYDWNRLDFLVTKLRQVHPLVTRDLERSCASRVHSTNIERHTPRSSPDAFDPFSPKALPARRPPG